MLHSNCNYVNPFISCVKVHNGKAYPFRDVPPLQNLRIWGMTTLSIQLFTATTFRASFTVGTNDNDNDFDNDNDNDFLYASST